MKSGEITLSVFPDISKAVHTIDFNTLTQKLHKIHFCKTFLYLSLNYLSNRTHFVQVDSKHYSTL